MTNIDTDNIVVPKRVLKKFWRRWNALTAIEDKLFFYEDDEGHRSAVLRLIRETHLDRVQESE
jgi:hypothetical protein